MHFTWLEDFDCDVPKEAAKKMAKANTKKKRNILLPHLTED